MAGSIGLSLTQQIDKDSFRPLDGGKLYFFEASTVADPQNAYQDINLTIPWPNPMVLDSSGRVPQLFFDDGLIKVRLLNSAGVKQFEADNIVVVGPSSGGGGGPSVDATTVFQTGDVLWLDVSGTRSGWVRDNGRTIGSATSGASERANADTSDLFNFLWNSFSNTVCPVSTGRGVSPSADFAANKTIQLPDKRGYVAGGLDDMGNSAASAYSNVPVIAGSATSAGSTIGESLHTLLEAELAAHNHGGATGSTTSQFSLSGTDPSATIPGTNNGTLSSGQTNIQLSATPGLGSLVSQPHTHTIASAGGGGAHNNVQKTVLGTFFRKL